MKLECIQNNIRISVEKSELNRLNNVGFITETINFGSNAQLTYALKIDEIHEEFCATFEDNLITIHIPVAHAEKWINSDMASLEAYDPIDDGELLHILIEKDFLYHDRIDEYKN